MKLHVFVHDKPVATLESADGFRHVMAYHPDVDPEQFVSLLMPVRTESYVYPDLHPIFRMNLPEGFLLSILQEQLGPQVGASPLNLLSVVGRNAIGRVKVACCCSRSTWRWARARFTRRLFCAPSAPNRGMRRMCSHRDALPMAVTGKTRIDCSTTINIKWC